MFTQCPECMTIFAIDAATIAQAHGCVGCGHCGATFDTMATLTDELPPAPFASLELNYPSAEPPLLVQRIEQADVPQQHLFETQAVADPARVAEIEADAPQGDEISTDEVSVDEVNVDEVSPDELDKDAPNAADEHEELATEQVLAGSWHEIPEDHQDDREAPATTLDVDAEIAAASARLSRRERMDAPLRKRLLLSCLGLAVCLLLQLAWAERAALARNPGTAPMVRSICNLLHCAPRVKDLDQLALISRDVRKHPSVANALIISATMRNNATFAQPFPIITITLSDLDDNRVAMRRFRPIEYLHDADIRAAGLAPGAHTALVFEVQDPGQDALAFEFSFE